MGKDKAIYDEKKFIEKYGYPPAGLTLYKAIHGDTSDNIPNAMKGMKHEILNSIASKFTTVQELVDALRYPDGSFYMPEKWATQVLHNRSRILLNYSLVDFIDVGEQEIKEATYVASYSPTHLHTLYTSLGLKPSQVDPRVIGYGAQRYQKPEFMGFRKINRA